MDVLLAAEDLPLTTADARTTQRTTWGRPGRAGDWFDQSEVVDDVQAGIAALGHPDVVVHRLALRSPLGPTVEDDLVAALSELVGFDPEPGVYCLAPATPEDGVLARAARRIARVYGLPLLRYRCLELSLVETDEPDTGPDEDTGSISLPSQRHAARG